MCQILTDTKCKLFIRILPYLWLFSYFRTIGCCMAEHKHFMIKGAWRDIIWGPWWFVRPKANKAKCWLLRTHSLMLSGSWEVSVTRVLTLENLKERRKRFFFVGWELLCNLKLYDCDFLTSVPSVVWHLSEMSQQQLKGEPLTHAICRMTSIVCPHSRAKSIISDWVFLLV